MTTSIDTQFLVDFLIDQAMADVQCGAIELRDIDWLYVERGLRHSATLEDHAKKFNTDQLDDIACDLQLAVDQWLDDLREERYRMNWELSLRSAN